jgi:hypothetical protein
MMMSYHWIIELLTTDVKGKLFGRSSSQYGKCLAGSGQTRLLYCFISERDDRPYRLEAPGEVKSDVPLPTGFVEHRSIVVHPLPLGNGDRKLNPNT